MTNDFDTTKDSVKQLLEQRGFLQKLRLELQQEFMQAIASDKQDQTSQQQLSKPTLILNGLVKEYLDFHGSRIPSTLTRSQIEQELGITADEKLPLLYSLIGDKQQ
jgi:protein-disulfide isomerase